MHEENFRLKKTAIVTGSSRGIGAQTAREFAQKGYNVVINYNKSKERAFSLLEEVRETSPHSCVIALKADVSKPTEAEYLINKTIEEFGNIDVLVNNAGISSQKLFTDISYEEWTNMFDVNIHGMFNCTQCAVKHMIRQHSGKIINVSSVWGVTGGSCEVHYSASKAAVIGFTKALAKELAPSNIQVNCVAPGFIDTEMNTELNLSEEEIEEIKNDTPCLRLGSVNDVSKMIVFLAGKDSDFIIGQTIGINGGILI